MEDYRAAIAWAPQTALRVLIGRMMLAETLRVFGRDAITGSCSASSMSAPRPGGVFVSSVEIRDIIILHKLEDAMSRQAAAKRERQARVALANTAHEPGA